MRVIKRISNLDHSIFILRDGECDQEVNQSKCKAETGPADKQVEDAQFPAVLQKAVRTTPAQKNSKQDIYPLIYLVAGAVLLSVGIFLQSTHDEVLLLVGNTGFLFGLVQLVLQMCHLAQASFVFIAALEAGNNRPNVKGGNAHFLLLERGQAAEHFVVIFIHRVAVCDLFLEAFVKSFVLFPSQGISAELRKT